MHPERPTEQFQTMINILASQACSKKIWLIVAISLAGVIAMYQLRDGAQSDDHREGKAIVKHFLADHKDTFGSDLHRLSGIQRRRLLDGLAKGEYPGLFGPNSLYVKTAQQQEAVLRYLMSELASDGHFKEFPDDDQDIQEARLD